MIARRAGARVVTRWEAPEAEQLVDLFTGVSALIADPDAAGGVDPARARLLPDGHRDDPGAAAGFRDMTEAGLIAAKRAALAACVGELTGSGRTSPARGRAAAAGDSVEVRLDEPGLARWLRTLNDVRLALGTRLESLGADLAAGRPPDGLARPDMAEAARSMWLVYRWLTGVQDELVELAMSGAG
ncbi:MAG: DUF2017 domain-containing protein [Frankiaceae bacterium]|jgi:hypothetical protein|nr:DUF2017 domain-containing protein [Frankiaceae bacterium]